MNDVIDLKDYMVVDSVVGHGGGGCFRAGTQIQLDNGKTISIELLNAGDEILAFDEYGKVHLAKVTKLHHHTDPQPILEIDYWRGKMKGITPNHWVQNQYSNFAEMGSLTAHDALIDGMGHLRPIIEAKLIGHEPVWNLTVEPYHTFIADGIRVHNGGHRERHPAVTGAGGGGGDSKGGGGGGRSAIEDPDTLQSRANVKIIDLIGEGMIGGLVNGAKSIFLNGTPLMNDSGVYNFTNVSWDHREGTPNQSIIPGFSSVETPYNLGSLKVTNSEPKTFTITNLNADRARVVMNIPALMQQDTVTGDTHGTSVSYYFDISVDGGAFVALGSMVTVAGKTKSKYQRSHVFDLPKPAASGWTIKVSRATADNNSSAMANDTYIDSYVEIVDAKVNYANSALISIGIDPETFSSNPSRSYLVDGLYMRVPSNYDAITKTYTGIWNGSFQLAVTSNPAWVLFDLLTSKRYGLGNYLSDSQVDKAMLYTIGRYCDELVPDGLGGLGMEPRFSINTQIQTQAEAYKLISDITSVFRGMSFWNGGSVCFRQDSPATPTMVFNQANIIGGDFNYTSSSRKDRHSVINVTWNDPGANYKQRVEYVEDHELIISMGIKKIDTVAFGCTSRGQAHRVGKWMLYSERYESNLITFKVGLDSSMLIPGEIVRLCDAFKSGRRAGGRALSSTLYSVTVDAPIAVTGGSVDIFIALPDGSFAQRTVAQSNGTFSTFSWSSPLPALPVDNAVFALSDQIVPMLARVIAVGQEKSDATTFLVTAIEHNPNKYAAVEMGVMLTQPQTTVALPYVTSITSLVADETTYFIAPGVIGSKLHVSWEGRASLFRTSYRTTLYGGASNWVTSETKVPAFDIPGLYQGSIVDIRVSGLNLLGNWTEDAVLSKTIEGKSAPPGIVTGLIAVGDWRSIILKWTNPSDIDFSHVEIWEGTIDDSAQAARIANLSGDTYTRSGLRSGQTRYYWLKAVDTTGNRSPFNTIQGTSATSSIEAGEIIEAMQKSVSEAALTRDLLTKINQIDLLGEASLRHSDIVYENISRIDKTAANSSASIATEQAIRASADEALSSQIVTVQANVSTNAAAISTETTARANADSAIASLITTVQANVDDNAAAIQVEAEARVTADSSLATQITTVQVNVDDNAAAVVTEQTARINADGTLGAQWTVKVNANGHIAGMGVSVSSGAAGPIASDIIMLADRFAVVMPAAGPGATPYVPFIVGTVNGTPSVVMSTAFIGDLTVDNTKIGNFIQSSNWNLENHLGWKIDKTGEITAHSITIRDSAGNVVMSSNTGTEWGKVSGLGKPANYADVTSANTAAGIANQGWFATLDQINSANISTYIAGAAIGYAQIGAAQIGAAHIQDLAVDTIKLAGNAVTVPTSFSAGYVNPGHNQTVTVIDNPVTFYGGTANILISWASPLRWNYPNGSGSMYLTQLPLTGYLYIDNVLALTIPYTFDSGAAMHSAILSGTHSVRLDWQALSGVVGDGAMDESHILIIEAKR